MVMGMEMCVRITVDGGGVLGRGGLEMGALIMRWG